MPKGHKRKNAGVGVDFKKAKHKVGKKLPQAKNATDTDVKSRAITLPEQSIATDKSGLAVTHRNLTLKVKLGKMHSHLSGAHTCICLPCLHPSTAPSQRPHH